MLLLPLLLPLLQATAAATELAGCSLAPPPPDNTSLTITVGATITVFPANVSLAGAGMPFVFANGDIQSLVRFGGNRSRAVRSSNAGLTWAAMAQQPPPFAQRATSEVRTYAAQLQPDGEVVLFSGFNNASRYGIDVNGENSGQDFSQRLDGSVETELLRSRDSGLTQHSTVAKLFLPVGLVLENLQHAAIVQLSNGSLLTATYGKWLCGGNKTSCLKAVPICKPPWVPHPCSTDADCHDVSGKRVTCGGQPPVCRNRTCYSPNYKAQLCTSASAVPTKGPDQAFTMISHDRGASWRYVSTIGASPGNASCLPGTPRPRLNEAWLSAVPDMHAAADGNGSKQLLVLFIRSDGPLYRSISTDSGGSWSQPAPAIDKGVSPTGAYLDSIGVFALAYGRPGNWLALSTSGGRSFGTPWCFRGEETSYDGSDYDAVVALPAVKPGEQQLMLSYKVCAGLRNCTAVATFVTVRVSGW
jgi:hypothetical protein